MILLSTVETLLVIWTTEFSTFLNINVRSDCPVDVWSDALGGPGGPGGPCMPCGPWGPWVMARELFVMRLLLVDWIVTTAARIITAAIRSTSVFFVSYRQVKYFGSNRYPLRIFVPYHCLSYLNIHNHRLFISAKTSKKQ